MSEEEKFTTIIQDIKRIYLSLTQGEPSPDEEIEARVSLINKIQELKEMDTSQASDNLQLFEETLNKLENWDTLDLWFTESDLPEEIKKIINITEELPAIEPEEATQEDIGKHAKDDLNSVEFDINKIVDQVSDKFRGEINDLKQEIDFLKHELELKDETLKKTTQKRVVKKIIPKREVKLPPPKIKIPVIRRPDVAPHVKAPNTIEEPKEKIGVKSIDDVQAKIEEEIEKLKPTPPIEEKPKIYDEMHEEAKSVLNILEELEPSPDISLHKSNKDGSSGSKSILDILDEEDTVLNIIEPKKAREKGEDSSETRNLTEEPPIKDENSNSKEETTFGAKMPKIKAVDVEEIDTKDIKSSGNELFNVFSSVGSEPVEKTSSSGELPSLEPAKGEKKKEEKKKRDQLETISFVNLGAETPQMTTSEETTVVSTEELPKDKDNLYQELIALEGKRYSLEKNYKEIEKNYNMGSIDDFEYKNQSDDLNKKLEEITSRINKIRRIIASM